MEGKPDLGLCSVAENRNPISMAIVGSCHPGLYLLGSEGLQKLEIKASHLERAQRWVGNAVGN